MIYSCDLHVRTQTHTYKKNNTYKVHTYYTHTTLSSFLHKLKLIKMNVNAIVRHRRPMPVVKCDLVVDIPWNYNLIWSE